MFVQTDVGSEESVQQAVATVIARFGAIHVCINGAALPAAFKVLGKEGKAAPLARFAQVTAINLNGVFNVMSKCAEQMARSEAENGAARGVVINVASGAASPGQVRRCADAAHQ